MSRRLLLILLLHYFQGSGYCSEVSSLPDIYSERNREGSLEADHSSSNDIQSFNNSDADQAVSQHNQPTSMRLQQDVKGSTDNRRQRRHIGSIAAFRGLPGPFNKFNPVEWPLPAGWDRKGFSLIGTDKMMAPGSSYDYMESPYGDVIKDKRYPDVIQMAMQKNNQPPNPVLMRNNPGTGSGGGNKNFEIVTPPHNEARARAVSRLLRLLSEAKTNSAGVNSISKKFLGALARNNALPVSKAVAPLVQYKGSTAIPLPGKRTPISSRIPLQSDSKDIVGDLEFANQAEDDSIDEMYSDDIAVGTDEDIDEYDGKITSMKRNIASLAAKGGWIRPSRTYNRVPQFSI